MESVTRKKNKKTSVGTWPAKLSNLWGVEWMQVASSVGKMAMDLEGFL